MKISKGTDIDASWTNSIAVSKGGSTWANLNVSNLSVRPQKSTDRDKKLKFKVTLLDGKEEVEWFFLDEVENQATWTNDMAGLTQAIDDITTWIGSIISGAETILSSILLELQQIEDNTSFNGKLLEWDTVGTTTYLGYATPGTATSSAGWSIKRWSETGNDGSGKWADGNNLFDNVWDDRLTLTYG